MIVPYLAERKQINKKHKHIINPDIQVRFNNLNAPEVFVDGVKKEIEYISYEYNRDRTVGQPRWIDIEYLDHGKVKKIYKDNSKRIE